MAWNRVTASPAGETLGNVRWPGCVGAAYFCVIGSVPLQQLQSAAGRETRIPVAKANSAPGAAYLGFCCPGTAPALRFCSQQGQPKGRWAKWDARVPGGRGTCPSSPPGLQPSVVQLAKKPLLLLVSHRLCPLCLEWTGLLGQCFSTCGSQLLEGSHIRHPAYQIFTL